MPRLESESSDVTGLATTSDCHDQEQSGVSADFEVESASAADHHDDDPRLGSSTSTSLDRESSSDLQRMDSTATSSSSASGWDLETMAGTPNDIAKSRDSEPVHPVAVSQKDHQW